MVSSGFRLLYALQGDIHFCRKRCLHQTCSEHGVQQRILVSLLEIESGPTIAELKLAMSSSPSFSSPPPTLLLSPFVRLMSLPPTLSTHIIIIIIMNCIILHFICFCTRWPNYDVIKRDYGTLRQRNYDLQRHQ